ncbi:hypothetical protein DYB25_013935 [Aphanomyces astaci]|uniref:Uncharacterized protein n=1 Tax=Aphanomyces astaci TaxID=112090 RepID=A0A396ZSH9_APHAT|nr:hypothetical protein DYB25_013935 [Aphanomyces astaci]
MHLFVTFFRTSLKSPDLTTSNRWRENRQAAQRHSHATPILRREMTTPNRDLHLTNIVNLAQALLTTAANLNMEVDHLARQPPTGDGQTGSEDWQQQRTEMETELARLRESNAHQRTQLAEYYRVHNKNKASHELLESRVQELLKRWSDDVANRDQQLRIRSVHRFWNWLGKTCALVNPKSVTVLYVQCPVEGG